MQEVALDVLGGIIPSHKDRLLHALHHLEPDHFTDQTHRVMWQAVARYYDIAGGVLPAKYIPDLLKRAGKPQSHILMFAQTYQTLSERQVTDDEFRFAVDGLKDLRAEHLTGESLTTAMEILTKGTEVGEGWRRREVRGHEAAREYLTEQMGVIDRMAHVEDAPEGDVRHEREEILSEYEARQRGEGPGSVMTGLDYVDGATSGLQNGELVMVCGYTGVGKSQLVTQMAWHVAVKQGKNVFFATSETIRPQVRRRLVARHSRQPQFGSRRGLNTTRLKDGTLDDSEVDVFRAVVDDLSDNPEYGRLYLAQIPRGATLSYVESRLSRQQQEWDVDLVVIDYLALLRPDDRREAVHAEFTDLIKDAKQIATSHGNGRGVPVVSPWAMRRPSWKDAVSSGQYTLASLSDTSEAEKSADLIVSLLKLPNAGNEVVAQILKNRDGEVPSPATLQVDHRSSYIGQRESSSIEDTLGDSVTTEADADDLAVLLGG